MSYFSRLPALGRKLQFDLFFPLKVESHNLKSQNQAIEHSRGSPEFPCQNLRQIFPGVLEFIQANR